MNTGCGSSSTASPPRLLASEQFANPKGLPRESGHAKPMIQINYQDFKRRSHSS